MNLSKKIIVITTALLLILVVAGLLYFFMSNEIEADNFEDNLSERGSSEVDSPETGSSEVGSYESSTLQQDEIEINDSARTEEANAFDVVKNMRVGWNLGNTFDSIDNMGHGIRSDLYGGSTPIRHYETLWRNPITTREMIDTVVDAGFGAIRVPVTFTDHMDENFQIRHEWLLRVEQVVGYVLDAGVYCIINIHHDTGSGSWPWLRADPDNIEQLSEQLDTVWTQIAEHFKDHNEKLIFESFNEILDTESRWNNASNAAYLAVNQLNQVFVDAVRATGGNNNDRYLIVKSYAAGIHEDILEAFVLPTDSVESRLIVGVHTYTPHTFTRTQEAAPWLETHSDWEASRDGQPVEDIMSRLNEIFVQRGIPVIIGEFGAMNKNNTVDRVNFARHFVETARRYNITCFWWDDGGYFPDADSVNNFAILDRRRTQWFFYEIVESLVEASS